LCVPVAAEVAGSDDVSVADGSAVVVAPGAVVPALDGTGPAEPLTRTDIDDAGLPGTLAQADTGVGVRALLAAATTPMRLIAPTPPSRPTRRVLDCAAYQSRMGSALL
jgi:hypothetical protein